MKKPPISEYKRFHAEAVKAVEEAGAVFVDQHSYGDHGYEGYQWRNYTLETCIGGCKVAVDAVDKGGSKSGLIGTVYFNFDNKEKSKKFFGHWKWNQHYYADTPVDEAIEDLKRKLAFVKP